MKELLNEINYTAIDTRATSLRRTTLDYNPQTTPVVSIEGILMDADRHWSLVHSDTLPSRCTVGDVADSSGEWTAIAEHRHRNLSSYLVFSDYAGYAPVFYAFLPGKAVVLSGSFSGAVQGLKSLGGNTTLNLGNYLTLITGRERTFETLIASETMANEIHILRPDEALSIEHHAVKIVNRAQLSPAASLDNYEQALRAAVEYTRNTISHVLSNNTEALPLITLTGGVDSRLILAFLNTTPFLHDFKVWTMDPRDKKEPNKRRIYTIDVEISHQIRKSYGLSWMSDWKRQKFSVSIAEALARHQSFYSNYSFQFYPAKHVQLEKDPILTLRGGGGEILRGSSNARIANAKYQEHRENGGDLQPVTWAASNYLSRSFLTNQLRPIAQNFLEEQLTDGVTNSVREKLDLFYRNHRNRAHFGHHRVSQSKRDFILQVLSNPYMQRLVELSDYDYVSSSSIVLDLFNATDPDLRKFPFESDSAHKNLYLPTSEPFSYDNRDGWMADFDAIKRGTEAYDYQPFAEPGHRGEHTQGDSMKLGLSFIRAGFAIIEQLAPAELRSALNLQHKRVLSRLENRQIPLGKFMAIVASTTDIVAPMALDTARHFFTGSSADSKILPKNVLHDAASPYRDLVA